MAVWPDYQMICTIFGHLQQCKFAQYHKKFAKVCWTMCQILNEPPNFVTMAEFLCQSGVISPDLVALIPGLFFIYFCLIKQTFKVLQQIFVKKCFYSIWTWDSNPQPSGHVSPPITTRPGLFLHSKGETALHRWPLIWLL